MDNFVWSTFSENELYTIKKNAEDEIHKRHLEKQEREKNQGLNILYRLYPTLNANVKIINCKITEEEIFIVFTPQMQINNDDKPPYSLRFEKRSYSSKERFSLHVDLHT